MDGGKGLSGWPSFRIGIEASEDLGEPCDAANHVMHQVRVDGPKLPGHKLRSRIELPAPAFDGSELFLAFFEGAPGLVNGGLLEGSRLAKIGETGAKEGLLGVLQVAGASSHLVFPMVSLVGFQPQSRPLEIGPDLLQKRSSPVEVNNQVGAEIRDGIHRSDLGALNHGNQC